MACKEYDGRVSELEDYLDGGLPAASAAEVSRHLEGCRECREAVGEAELGGRLLRAGMRGAALRPSSVYTSSAPTGEEAEASDAVWAGVAARIAAEEMRQRKAGEFWTPLESLALRLTWTAGLAVALLAAYVATIEPARRLGQETRASETRQMFPEPVEEPATPDEVLLTLATTSNGTSNGR